LAERMVGRSISNLYAARRGEPGRELLRVEKLSRYGFFHDVSFHVREGEILGLAGLSGAGRSELARSLCGIDPVDAGCIRLNGRTLRPGSTQAAIRAGLAYLTEDRKQQGLASRLGMGENVLSALTPRHCAFGVYLAGRARGLLGSLIGSLEIHPPEPKRTMSTFSGGNQQKALLAKWLATSPEVLILDEPTRGVDVGAKVIIHKAIAELADAGKSVVLISSDLPELVGLSDRIVVMRKGHLIGEMARADCTEASVLLAANGEGELLPA
ncbi:MAG TPA: ATP-binding cassette domain-containing protein, partial [Phycisphaerae bacterium]|nr:ATP-binding cassette domain-containing protein [Phycisphaerae bacterium]